MRGFFSRLFRRGNYYRIVAVDKLGYVHESVWAKVDGKNLADTQKLIQNDLTYITFLISKTDRVTVPRPVSMKVEVR